MKPKNSPEKDNFLEKLKNGELHETYPRWDEYQEVLEENRQLKILIFTERNAFIDMMQKYNENLSAIEKEFKKIVNIANLYKEKSEIYKNLYEKRRNSENKQS